MTQPGRVAVGAIYWAGIARVHHANDRATAAEAGVDDARLYREIALPVEDRALPMVQHLADEAKAAFDAWQARVSKTGPTAG